MGHFEKGVYVLYDHDIRTPFQLKDGSWGLQIRSTKTTPPCEQYCTGAGYIDVTDMPMDPTEKKLKELEERIAVLEGRKCECHRTS